MRAAVPPVVFLPGLCETSAIWRPAAGHLGLTPQSALAPELPGHCPGDTPEAVRAALRSGAWLDRLAAEMLRRFKGRPAVVVGHSTGGMLAIALARRHPSAVARLCLVNSLTGLPRTGRFSRRRRLLLRDGTGAVAFRLLWRLWLSTPATFRRGMAASANGPLRLPAAEAMRRHLARCDPLAVRETARWAARTDVGGDLARIDAPVLAVIGRADPVVPPETQVAILRTARAAHALLLGGGHLLPMEAPDALNAALAAWRGAAPSTAPSGGLALAAE